MAYNEAALCPIWARHYSRQVGADHCFIIDHGSSEDFALPQGINRLRIPRSAHDDERRAAFVSKFAESLLRYFDWVLYTDVDELVIADPCSHRNLPAFCAAQTVPVVNAIGFDVQHVPSLESDLDPSRLIGVQRNWIRFTSAMCKPVLTRVPILWSPGFHSSDQPISFADLFLFHLHWADLSIGLNRLKRTRNMAWADQRFGSHQRIPDREWLALFHGMASLPRAAEDRLDRDQAPLSEWLDRTVESGHGREGQTFKIDLGVNADELWPIPARFREAF